MLIDMCLPKFDTTKTIDILIFFKAGHSDPALKNCIHASTVFSALT